MPKFEVLEVLLSCGKLWLQDNVSLSNPVVLWPVIMLILRMFQASRFTLVPEEARHYFRGKASSLEGAQTSLRIVPILALLFNNPACRVCCVRA